MTVLENKIDITKKLRAEVVKAILSSELVLEIGIKDADPTGVYYYHIVMVDNKYYKLETFEPFFANEMSYYAQIPIPVIPVSKISYIEEGNKS